MATITVLGTGTFEVEQGKKLVLALEDNGVNILHRCGGKAKCTTCRIEVLAGDYYEVTKKETHLRIKELKIICVYPAKFL